MINNEGRIVYIYNGTNSVITWHVYRKTVGSNELELFKHSPPHFTLQITSYNTCMELIYHYASATMRFLQRFFYDDVARLLRICLHIFLVCVFLFIYLNDKTIMNIPSGLWCY